MSILNALVFGFIQGLTEYIPVSSSAHLQVLFSLFGLNSTGFNTETFVAFAHFGTILVLLSCISRISEKFYSNRLNLQLPQEYRRGKAEQNSPLFAC